MNESKKILSYSEVLTVTAGNSAEPLVSVKKFDKTIISEYEKLDMLKYTGTDIYVRDSVAQKIARINSFLKTNYQLNLRVLYGYRHPDIQIKYFKKRRSELKKIYPDLSESELDELTHNFVAVPDVGGHPTGGAIDLTLCDNKGEMVDMGTKIADYTDPEKIKTFGKGVSDEQMKYRIILHDAMLKENFAPFYGEWWHFSYGDREWGRFYDKLTAIYGPVNFTTESLN